MILVHCAMEESQNTRRAWACTQANLLLDGA